MSFYSILIEQAPRKVSTTNSTPLENRAGELKLQHAVKLKETHLEKQADRKMKGI